ncbi:MAG: hypothetical protein NVS9B15_00630 [Acidobacteriaceae bacterium]
MAVFFAFCASLVVANVVLKLIGLHDFNIGITHTSLAAIVGASSLVFGVGLLDDIFGCAPVVKLICEVGAASFAYAGGVRIGSFPYLGQDFGHLVSFVITVAFIVFVTNAFNLLDGMDGLAAGSALVSTFALAAAASLNHRNPILLITAGLAGVLLAFLRFNFNPATIFLGDSGSLFIGFLLSCASIAGTQKLPTLVAAIVPMLIFAVPMLDTSLSVGRRALRGHSIFAADRDHIHHRLLQGGRSQRQVVLAIYGVSGACASLMLLMLYNARATVLVIAAVVTVLTAFVARMKYPDFAEMRAALGRVMARRTNLSKTIRLRLLLQELNASTEPIAPLHKLNEFFSPDSEMEIVVGPADAVRVGKTPREHRWKLELPVIDNTGIRLGTLLLHSRTQELPFEITLLHECGLLLCKHQENSVRTTEYSLRREAVAS